MGEKNYTAKGANTASSLTRHCAPGAKPAKSPASTNTTCPRGCGGAESSSTAEELGRSRGTLSTPQSSPTTRQSHATTARTRSA